ncbi:Plasma membrane sulfite pump involved in sulfite metabolism [Coemansia sp. RSA 487]|nr:Plasma membrane sulfite pump involved in sulfite metabolism [Coemansia sp. RSA 487]
MQRLEKTSDVIRGFTPAWFTVTMGTGITGILMYKFPYPCAPLRYVAMATALFNLILFTLFSVLFLWRLIRYRDFYSILLHPQMSMALGAIPMGMSTLIISLVTMITPYGAPWVPTLSLVLWAVNVALSLLTFFIVPFAVITHQEHTLEKVNATMILPIVSTVVAASTGAIVCTLYDGDIATSIIVVSYSLWGMGLGLSTMVTVVYLLRLTFFKLPPKEAIVSVFIPLGPLGQSSYGIQLLGGQSLRIFPASLPHIKYLGEVLNCIGFFLGLLIWSMAIWWLLQATYSVIYTRILGKVPFNLGWWAFIFPIGTFASSSNSLWNITSYRFFRVVSAIVISALILLWLCVLLNTIRYAWTGELLQPASISQLELQNEVYSDEEHIHIEVSRQSSH